MLKLTESDNHKTVALKIGEKVQISLVWNPSTGYFWQEGDSTAGVLEQINHGAESKTPGAPTTVHFIFRITGSGDIILSYGRAWDETNPPAKWFQIQVMTGAEK